MLDMNDQEKSVLLAKAMTDTDGIPFFMLDLKESLLLAGAVQVPLAEIETYVYNLYDPANMALAWKCLNWAIERDDSVSFRTWGGETKRESFGFTLNQYLGHMVLGALPPADAQRLWLNKILELAIEAGLIEVQDAT